MKKVYIVFKDGTDKVFRDVVFVAFGYEEFSVQVKSLEVEYFNQEDIKTYSVY